MTLPTAQITEALIRHYRPPGRARGGEILLTEVAAPPHFLRRADLVRVGMTRSRGQGIDVHEVKATRSDWLRELDDPDKAEAWWPYCNRFWVVTVPGVVNLTELPSQWGLMEMPGSGRRFRVLAKPAEREAQLTVPLLVELLRRCDNGRLGELDVLRQRHRDELYKREREWQERAGQASLPLEQRERLQFLEALEAAVGLKPALRTWYYEDLRRMSPDELATALDGARDQVAAQRLIARADARHRALRDFAQRTLAELDRDPADMTPAVPA